MHEIVGKGTKILPPTAAPNTKRARLSENEPSLGNFLFFLFRASADSEDEGTHSHV